jgi:hypothetical protein
MLHWKIYDNLILYTQCMNKRKNNQDGLDRKNLYERVYNIEPFKTFLTIITITTLFVFALIFLAEFSKK